MIPVTLSKGYIMTDNPRDGLETVLNEIRGMFADLYTLRRKVGELQQHFARQLREGTISQFRYSVEVADINRMERTMQAQWIRLQQQRSHTLEKLRRLV